MDEQSRLISKEKTLFCGEDAEKKVERDDTNPEDARVYVVSCTIVYLHLENYHTLCLELTSEFVELNAMPR